MTMTATTTTTRQGKDCQGEAFDVLRSFFVRGLDRNDQLLMLLRYAEGMSHAEIARTLDLTPEQVTARHDAVYARLREAAASEPARAA